MKNEEIDVMRLIKQHITMSHAAIIKKVEIDK